MSIILSAQIYEIWNKNILHEQELLWIQNMRSIEDQDYQKILIVVENFSICYFNNNFNHFMSHPNSQST